MLRSSIRGYDALATLNHIIKPYDALGDSLTNERPSMSSKASRWRVSDASERSNRTYGRKGCLLKGHFTTRQHQIVALRSNNPEYEKLTSKRGSIGNTECKIPKELTVGKRVDDRGEKHFINLLRKHNAIYVPARNSSAFSGLCSHRECQSRMAITGSPSPLHTVVLCFEDCLADFKNCLDLAMLY